MDEFVLILRRKYGPNLKQLGFPTKYLGWEILHTPDQGMLLLQHLLARTTLAQAGMEQAKGKLTPYPAGTDLHPPPPPTPDEHVLTQQHANYRQLVGDLRYLADSTRPDLATSAGKLGAASHALTARHFALLKATLRYLRSHSNFALAYKPSPHAAKTHIRIQLFSDSDWANDKANRKSHTGAAVFINNCLVSWISHKQPIVADSTAEAEYVALHTALPQATLVLRLLRNLRIHKDIRTDAWVDNLPTIEMLRNIGGTKRRKFIDLRHYSIIDKMNRYSVRLRHVSSVANIADLFTKPLPRPQFQVLRDGLGLFRAPPLDTVEAHFSAPARQGGV